MRAKVQRWLTQPARGSFSLPAAEAAGLNAPRGRGLGARCKKESGQLRLSKFWAKPNGRLVRVS